MVHSAAPANLLAELLQVFFSLDSDPIDSQPLVEYFNKGSFMRLFNLRTGSLKQWRSLCAWIH